MLSNNAMRSTKYKKVCLHHRTLPISPTFFLFSSILFTASRWCFAFSFFSTLLLHTRRQQLLSITMTVYSASSSDYSRYSTTPSPPPPGSILYDLAHNDELLAMKVALRNQLKQNRLPNTPVGFPVFLRSTHSRQAGRDGPEFQSGEFYQEVYTSGSGRRSKHMAKISFLAPHKPRTGMLQWTVSVPARGSFGWQHDEGEEPC